VQQQPGMPGRSFTTPAMIELERETDRPDACRPGAICGVVTDSTREAIAREHEHLNERQSAAVREILANCDQVMVLEGTAGAGRRRRSRRFATRPNVRATKSRASRRPPVPPTSWPRSASSRIRCSGSKTLGIEAGDYARVEHTDAKRNQVTVRTDDERTVNYDPRRLQGVTIYRETEWA